MSFIMDMLKGMVMGIANVIPGVSGGTMAVAMGIYDKLIHALTHIFKELKKSIVTVLPIGIGMVIGIVGLSIIIEWMFGNIPIQTNLLFIGLIAGGVPVVAARLKGIKIGAAHVIGFIAFFALVISLSFVQRNTEKAKEELKANKDEVVTETELDFSPIDCVGFLGAGVVASGTMVIPGVSGSMMMMVMGLYEKIISSISTLVKGLAALDFASMTGPLMLLIPFGIGAVIGLFAIAKLIEVLISKAPGITFSCILGLIAGSPIAIVVVNLDTFKNIDVLSGITGVICLAIGFVIAFFLGREEAPKEEVADKE